MITAKQIMEKAVEVLENNEWGKGCFKVLKSDGKYCYCLMGALGEAHKLISKPNICLSFEEHILKVADGYLWDIVNSLKIKINPYYKTYLILTKSIISWNDNIATSKQQIINKLREGAKNMNASK